MKSLDRWELPWGCLDESVVKQILLGQNKVYFLRHCCFASNTVDSSLTRVININIKSGEASLFVFKILIFFWNLWTTEDMMVKVWHSQLRFDTNGRITEIMYMYSRKIRNLQYWGVYQFHCHKAELLYFNFQL